VARLASLLVAAATAVAPPAAAQRSSRREPARQATARFEEGKQAYDAGEFDRAIELWRKGYELKDDPVFLYNIAQAYRQKGDYPRAIFYYKAYLREDPRARHRDEVEARVSELEKLVEAQERATEPPPAKDPVPPPREPAPERALEPDPPPADEPPPTPGRGLKIGGAVTGGLGVVALGAGVVFLLRSSSIESDLQASIDAMEPWTPELADKESDGRTASTLGWLGLGAGAALLTTGVVLYLTGAQKDSRARRDFVLVPQLGPEGLGAAATISF
jgi:tetratricopeptide (TPR) repeat protein